MLSSIRKLNGSQFWSPHNKLWSAVTLRVGVCLTREYQLQTSEVSVQIARGSLPRSNMDSSSCWSIVPVQVPTEVRTKGGKIGGSPQDWLSFLTPQPSSKTRQSQHSRVSGSYPTIMALQLDAAKHISITILLKKGFEN